MIVDTINVNQFTTWLANSDSYKNNFSYEGAKALFEYLERLSDMLRENIEYDPIAWCCTWTEYKSLDELKQDYDNIETLEDLQDKTTVIEFDGGLIVQEF